MSYGGQGELAGEGRAVFDIIVWTVARELVRPPEPTVHTDVEGRPAVA